MTDRKRGKSSVRRAFVGPKLLVAAIGIVAAGGGALLIASGQLGGGGEAIAQGAFAKAKMMSFDVTANASGDLEARESLELKNPLESNAQIEFIEREGKFVEAGAELVRLNTQQLEDQLDNAKLSEINAKNEVDQAESSLAIQISENESALRDAELNVELRELALTRWREGEVAKRREQLRIALDRAERELSRLGEKVVKSKELHAKNFLSKDELERDEIALEEAKANLTIAELDIEIYETYQYPEDEKTKKADVENAIDAKDRVIERNAINKRNKEAARDAKKQQYDLRKQTTARLTKQIDDAVIKAPRDGMVVYGTTLGEDRWRRDDQPLGIGSTVSPRQTLIVLPDTSKMVASVQIHEALHGLVRQDQRANVIVDAVGGRFAGSVSSVSVLAQGGNWRDPNRREYTVKIELDPEQDGLEKVKPSMRCDARIVVASVQDTLSIPAQAVFSERGVSFVYVRSGGGMVRPKPVRVGLRSDMYAQVLAGLEDGEDVLIIKPDPEIIDDVSWDEDELATAGYELDDKGRPRVKQSAPRSGRAGGTQYSGSSGSSGKKS